MDKISSPTESAGFCLVAMSRMITQMSEYLEFDH